MNKNIEILRNNGCHLKSIHEKITNNTTITILCSCGHMRSSRLGNIVRFQQYKCVNCMRRNSLLTHMPNTKDKFKKRILQFNSKYVKVLKNRDDFTPANIHKSIVCRQCKVEKPLYRFYFRKNYANNKEKLCKSCEKHNREIRIMNMDIDTRIKICLRSSYNRSQRKKIISGRNEFREFNIDFSYIKSLYDEQQGKCRYSGRLIGIVNKNRDIMSIDRIDSKLGYIRTNVQLVSSTVNWMKSDLEEIRFMELVRIVYNNITSDRLVDDCDYTILYGNEDIIKHIRTLIRTCKYSAKKRKDCGRIECGIININENQIMKLLEYQKNRCALSGIEFEWNDTCDNIFKMSIDRIDNEKGYTIDNVQLVANIFNQMKSNLQNETFFDYIKDIYHTTGNEKKF